MKHLKCRRAERTITRPRSCDNTVTGAIAIAQGRSAPAFTSPGTGCAVLGAAQIPLQGAGHPVLPPRQSHSRAQVAAAAAFSREEAEGQRG